MTRIAFVGAGSVEFTRDLLGDILSFPELADAVGRRLADVLGIAIEVRVVRPGELDALTEIETSPKPKRFKDERG